MKRNESEISTEGTEAVEVKTSVPSIQPTQPIASPAPVVPSQPVAPQPVTIPPAVPETATVTEAKREETAADPSVPVQVELPPVAPNQPVVVVDDEFKKLLPPLTDAEFAALKEDIKNNGCTEPISVWKTTITRPHNHLYKERTMQNFNSFNELAAGNGTPVASGMSIFNSEASQQVTDELLKAIEKASIDGKSKMPELEYFEFAHLINKLRNVVRRYAAYPNHDANRLW